MSKKDEALKLALESLEDARTFTGAWPAGAKAIAAIKEAMAEQPAQGCDYCNHPQYAGTKCKNCGREQPAQQNMPKIGCVNHDCDKCKAQQQEPVAVKQIAEALRKHGLTLVKTAHSYHAMDLGRIEAQTTSPQSKSWVPLTEFDIDQIPYSCSHADSRLIAYAIEAKLKERNS